MIESIYSKIELAKRFIDPGSIVVHVGATQAENNLKNLFSDCIYKTASHYKYSDYFIGKYEWGVPSQSVDAIINHVLHNDPFFWKTLFNMSDCLKVNGIVCLILPYQSSPHSSKPLYIFDVNCIPHFAEYMSMNVEETWNDKENSQVYSVLRKI